MYELDEYVRRNREITDLCQVLEALIEKKALWNNPIVNELIDLLNDKINTQLIREDTTLFPTMLENNDQALNRLAGLSQNHSAQLLKLCSSNRARWHNPQRSASSDQALERETWHMFDEIRKHMELESNKLFPRMREQLPTSPAA